MARKRKTYSEADVLALIAQGQDAEAIINEKLPGAAAKFARLDKALCAYLAHVRRTFPDAEFYTAGGGFTLLLGKSHDDKDNAQKDLLAFMGRAEIGDGDW